ncbi:hypothetical protein HDU98_004383, partial [Podochytrium sp. JEL0797]
MADAERHRLVYVPVEDSWTALGAPSGARARLRSSVTVLNDENANLTEPIRRSERMSMAPVEYFKGEKPIYVMKRSGSGC